MWSDLWCLNVTIKISFKVYYNKYCNAKEDLGAKKKQLSEYGSESIFLATWKAWEMEEQTKRWKGESVRSCLQRVEMTQRVRSPIASDQSFVRPSAVCRKHVRVWFVLLSQIHPVWTSLVSHVGALLCFFYGLILSKLLWKDSLQFQTLWQIATLVIADKWVMGETDLYLSWVRYLFWLLSE